MSVLSNLVPQKVFAYFEDLCAIPHGSENMKQIADYCVEFAKSHNLEYRRDSADNVVIWKNGTKGNEDKPYVMLQGHLDMVCQKTPDCTIDFNSDGLRLLTDGDFIFADGTSLGADNGIAVAMILSILSDNTLDHPPIEAVFTTDEEIGMIGAGRLDMSSLRSKMMVNIDAEEDNIVTVSCAGGCDLKALLPRRFDLKRGVKAKLVIGGLKGGHSGVEINSHRTNSNILLGRLLTELSDSCKFEIISVNGGDKCNAITNRTEVDFLVQDVSAFSAVLEQFSDCVSAELRTADPDFFVSAEFDDDVSECAVFSEQLKKDLIFVLATAPNGVMKMSADIEGLVETSLNLGILSTSDDGVLMVFALRSNLSSGLSALEKKLKMFFSRVNAKVSSSGHYPPWEYRADSSLRDKYLSAYEQVCGEQPLVAAIHAGLECGLFSANIDGLDCIAIGPQIYDVHTVNEKLCISSVAKMYKILTEFLKDF